MYIKIYVFSFGDLNLCVFMGKYINVSRADDGTLYPTFNRPRYSKNFTFQDFCREAAEELIVVTGLVESEK